MPYDGSDFSKWCLDLERRLDPAARMSHFLSLELGQDVVADPFQVEAITSQAPTVALRICRQAGKSCVLATRAVMELERGGTVIAVAQAERFAKELCRKVAIYLRGTDLLAERATLTEIEVNTGGRLIAVPASGSTIRGYTASLILGDEVAFWEGGGEDMIAAVAPMLTREGQLFLASTPAGKNNYFSKLFIDENGRPRTDSDVHRIVVKGTEIPRMAEKVEKLRKTLSATKFRQEVEVEMLSDGVSYFDLSLIEQATSKESAICPRM